MDCYRKIDHLPKKLEFKRDLVNVRISWKLHDFLVMHRRHREPLDRVADRIFGDSNVREMVETYQDAEDIIEGLRRVVAKLTQEGRLKDTAVNYYKNRLKESEEEIRKLKQLNLNIFLEERLSDD